MTEHKVVDLVDAGVPADQGLSSLGLIMQLGGSVLAASASLFLFILLLMKPGGGDETLWVFLILGMSIARSFFHRSAGATLLYGAPSLDGGSRRLAGVRRYVTFALIQSAIVAVILGLKFQVPGSLALSVGLGLAAWPIGLGAILALPRFKRFADDLPVTEDKGFEGASILMTVLGLCGLAGAAMFLLIMLDMPGKELQKGPGVLVVLSLLMLIARSFIHVQAGFSGLRETSIDRSVELANRYANFGVISSFCAGGAFLLYAMSSRLDLAGLAFVCGLVWMLMAWPMIIRRFYSDRQFSDLLAGDNAPLHRRAPDAGLTALGWLLLAWAFYGLSFTIPAIVMGRTHGMREASALLSFGGPSGMRSMWWSIGVTVMQAWAGWELIRMSSVSRIVSTAYGVVGVAVTLYVQWPLIKMMRHAMVGGGELATLLPVIMSLILPVATILLVNRKIAPTARARFKAKTE